MTSHTSLWQWTAALAALTLQVGCGDDTAGVPVEDCVPQTVASNIGSSRAATVCPIWECGSNSAEVNELTVGELHMRPGENTGEVNQWGAQVVRFIAPDGSEDYDLTFENGRLTAKRGQETLVGDALVDASIVVRDVEDCIDTELRIVMYGQEASWTVDDYSVDRFVFVYDDGDIRPDKPVCKEALEPVDEGAWAAIVAGERYLWDSKTVLATGDDASGWFNIACHGNAMYKMKLMGYDPQPEVENPRATTSEQRQSAIKMVTADYCGTGESFTETGTLVHWVNAGGWSENSIPPDSDIEAYWNHEGALCIDTPRRGTDSLDAIHAECATLDRTLTTCADYTGAYEWESRTPAPPLPPAP